ncbi:MAG TPA: 2OG-Fe(II) oxygenase [Sphingomicrobium sp.]|nr:2OG-Fe(II) oxygenase [Sphingomicrobium sp.]
MNAAPLEDLLRRISEGSAEAVSGLRQIASTGNAQALFHLADLTWSGHRVPQDPPRGRLLFEYAAALGHGEANVLATNLLGSGIAGKRDWSAALARLEAESAHLPERCSTYDLIKAMEIDPNGDPLSVPEGTVLATAPEVQLFSKVLTAAECHYLIDIARSRFQPSMVFTKARELVRDEIRTSDGAAIHWLIEDPVVHALNRRIAALTRTNYEQGEPLQALRYAPGQEYRPHVDYVEGAEVPRLWTALIYLNEDYEGGETAFVRKGIEVRGQTGDVLVFRNARDDGAPDRSSEHAGRPVVAGTKYLATRWVRAARWTV